MKEATTTTKPGLGERMGVVLATAQELGLDASARAWGKYSASLSLNICEGHSDRVDVVCSGEKYWIVLEEDAKNHPEKWSMPRADVKNDRADLFLIDVMKAYASENAGLSDSVALVLGIGSIASRSYCQDVLQKKRKQRMTAVEQ